MPTLKEMIRGFEQRHFSDTLNAAIGGFKAILTRIIQFYIFL